MMRPSHALFGCRAQTQGEQRIPANSILDRIIKTVVESDPRTCARILCWKLPDLSSSSTVEKSPLSLLNEGQLVGLFFRQESEPYARMMAAPSTAAASSHLAHHLRG
jgi:hypothetical protein